MSEDTQPPKWGCEVTFRVEFKQNWTTTQGATEYMGRSALEKHIEGEIKAGRITLNSLLHDRKKGIGDCRFDGITILCSWPKDLQKPPPEPKELERLRFLNEELEGELHIVDCSGYEAEA